MAERTRYEDVAGEATSGTPLPAVGRRFEPSGADGAVASEPIFSTRKVNVYYGDTARSPTSTWSSAAMRSPR